MSQQQSEQAVVRVPVVDVRIVPINTVFENPWNPNVQSDRVYEAERESIRQNGFVEPIAVRPHPLLDGAMVGESGDGWSENAWQIINGAHRRRAAEAEGYETISLNNLGPVSDFDAKRLTIILNETKGEAELVPLSQLLAELGTQTTLEELLIGLPYESKELEDLLAIGRQDWDTFTQGDGDAVEDFLKQATRSKYTVFLEFDKGQKEKYVAFIEILQREAEDPDFTAEQAVIDALAAACQKL